MLEFWHSNEKLKEYLFPGQDFLADFSKGGELVLDGSIMH
jgi:hypothetical protein